MSVVLKELAVMVAEQLPLDVPVHLFTFLMRDRCNGSNIRVRKSIDPVKYDRLGDITITIGRKSCATQELLVWHLTYRMIQAKQYIDNGWRFEPLSMQFRELVEACHLEWDWRTDIIKTSTTDKSGAKWVTIK